MVSASKNGSDSSEFISPTHYIGIGASAGGLEALQTLLHNLPTETGACFVIVQHLSPDFKSMMLELLSKHTSMDIQNVEKPVLAKPNTVYLLPPKKNMIVSKGELRLTDKVPDTGLNLPIDVFFRSLADDQQEKAIGIILSGTGSDGSRGLKTLKEAGALVIAQEPESAKFDGMPNSAIKTGIIDLILLPSEMGKHLAQYIQHPLVSGESEKLRNDMEVSQDVMSEIFNILRIKSNIDFSKYKPSTIARRIERRMTIKQITSIHDYLTLLFKDTYEVQVLGKELLIGVTSFFRDDDAFKLLREEVIPKIVSQSKEGVMIKVWVAACSTGEEAYSIAILLQDELAAQALSREVKIFATDVNADSISDASTGAYSADITNDIPPELLKKYFVSKPTGGFQVSQKIRDTVVFATHNMIVDPPFSNIDLVTCRNVLIYFQQSIQQRVLSSFHFALKKDGFLFLGSSENLSDLAVHFRTISERQKIFLKTNDYRLNINNRQHDQSIKKTSNKIPSVSTLMKSYRGNNAIGTSPGFANEALITEYVPPCILLNDDYEALHIYGDTGMFVKRLPPGRISIKISDIVNDDISIAVSSALQRARNNNEEVYYTDMQTHSGDELVTLNLRVKYVKEHDVASSSGYFWVIFEKEDSKANNKLPAVKFNVSQQAKQRIDDLELELKFSQEHLQVTVEELETTNEELQSTNEELMSSNEELQSTNEELQSVNEELFTVNTEFQEKISEISQANDDLDEVLNLSKIGIIFLDENLLIRRYTEAVTAYVNLLESDINRPLHHISKTIPYDNMLNDVARVFHDGGTIEKEITLEDKTLLRVSINPYQYEAESQSQGVSITFADISRARYIEMGMVVAYKELRSTINNALDMLDNKSFNKLIRLIAIDDNPTHLELLAHHLSKIDSFNLEIVTATNISEAVDKINEKSFDICIADFYLENESAIDLIDVLATENITLPVIVITGDVNEDLSPLLLSHGALDLIEKDQISPALLDRSIRFAIRKNEIDGHISNLIVDSVNKTKLS